MINARLRRIESSPRDRVRAVACPVEAPFVVWARLRHRGSSNFRYRQWNRKNPGGVASGRFGSTALRHDRAFGHQRTMQDERAEPHKWSPRLAEVAARLWRRRNIRVRKARCKRATRSSPFVPLGAKAKGVDGIEVMGRTHSHCDAGWLVYEPRSDPPWIDGILTSKVLVRWQGHASSGCEVKLAKSGRFARTTLASLVQEAPPKRDNCGAYVPQLSGSVNRL
jgi:hypothetical protein